MWNKRLFKLAWNDRMIICSCSQSIKGIWDPSTEVLRGQWNNNSGTFQNILANPFLQCHEHRKQSRLDFRKYFLFLLASLGFHIVSFCILTIPHNKCLACGSLLTFNSNIWAPQFQAKQCYWPNELQATDMMNHHELLLLVISHYNRDRHSTMLWLVRIFYNCWDYIHHLCMTWHAWIPHN